MCKLVVLSFFPVVVRLNLEPFMCLASVVQTLYLYFIENITFIYLCVGVCIWVSACHDVHTEFKGQLQKSVLSFHRIGLRD